MGGGTGEEAKGVGCTGESHCAAVIPDDGAHTRDIDIHKPRC